MSNCVFVEQCTFFDIHMSNKPTTANIYKNLFCDLNPKTCARYLTAEVIGHDNVPVDLFPHMKNKVNTILAEKASRDCRQ